MHPLVRFQSGFTAAPTAAGAVLCWEIDCLARNGMSRLEVHKFSPGDDGCESRPRPKKIETEQFETIWNKWIYLCLGHCFGHVVTPHGNEIPLFKTLPVTVRSGITLQVGLIDFYTETIVSPLDLHRLQPAIRPPHRAGAIDWSVSSLQFQLAQILHNVLICDCLALNS